MLAQDGAADSPNLNPNGLLVTMSHCELLHRNYGMLFVNADLVIKLGQAERQTRFFQNSRQL